MDSFLFSRSWLGSSESCLPVSLTFAILLWLRNGIMDFTVEDAAWDRLPDAGFFASKPLSV